MTRVARCQLHEREKKYCRSCARASVQKSVDLANDVRTSNVELLPDRLGYTAYCRELPGG